MTHSTFTALSADERKAVRQNWPAKCATASDHLLRAALLGTSPAKHFTPITNSVKLANGARPYMGAVAAASQLRFDRDNKRYREFLGLSLEQMQEPLHVARLKAIREWTLQVCTAELPEAL